MKLAGQVYDEQGKKDQFITELIANDLPIGVYLVDDTCAPGAKKFQSLLSTSLPAQTFRKEKQREFGLQKD